MQEAIRLLVAEDDPDDVELLRQELSYGGLRCRVKVVSDAANFESSLTEFAPQVILSDYTMPVFSGLDALALARKHCPETPFIFVSGTIGEERAVEALRAGASDYLIKDRLSRLVPAIRRALDETYRVRERLVLDEQLRQAQKIQMVGNLAGGVAHDFNNILTAISGYGELVLSTLPPDDARRADMEEIAKAVDRAATLTGQLLSFTRKRPLKLQLLDLGHIAENMAKMLRRIIGENIRLAISADANLDPVEGDAGQLEQVLLNLAVNARDAMPKGGTLTVQTCLTRIGPEGTASLPPGTYVTWTIGDTGCGIPPEVAARLFEPFFTTKPQGTGLGLTTAKGIVDRFGGRIEAASEPGRGTVFQVHFPVAAGRADSAESPRSAATASRGNETVLLLEDDPVLLALYERSLADNGYRVLQARNGAEALRLATARGTSVAILVTDIVLPGLSGPEAARGVAAVQPGLKILFLSGYIDDVLQKYALAPERVSFIQKPFRLVELSAKVRRLLDQPGPGQSVPKAP